MRTSHSVNRKQVNIVQHLHVCPPQYKHVTQKTISFTSGKDVLEADSHFQERLLQHRNFEAAPNVWLPKQTFL